MAGVIVTSEISFKTLHPGDDLYDRVTGRMQETILPHKNNMRINISSYKFQGVFEITNNPLKQRYDQKRKSLEHENGSNSEIWEAFHGSPLAETIAREGFQKCLPYQELRFGAGTYMAPHSSKANHYTFYTDYQGNSVGCDDHGDEACKLCTRCILMCKCIMGKKYTAKGPISAIPEGFDSLVADPSENPQMAQLLQYPEYLIRDTDQILPSVLIQYTI